LFTAVLTIGFVGAAGPASAAIIHEEVTIDTDQITIEPSDPPTPGDGSLVSVCLLLFGSAPICIVI
jgi:hypothetical protein